MKHTLTLALSSALVLASFSAFANGAQPKQHPAAQRGAQSSNVQHAQTTTTSTRTAAPTVTPAAHRAPAPASGAHAAPAAAHR